MSAIDYQAETKAIIGEFSAFGKIKTGDALLGAISSGATGTEIAMNIRFQLRELSANSDQLSPELNMKIYALLKHLDELLK
jgi:hypothetical protein